MLGLLCSLFSGMIQYYFLSAAGASQCLGILYRYFGRRIVSGLLETTSIVSKLLKFNEVSQNPVHYELPNFISKGTCHGLWTLFSPDHARLILML